MHTLLRKLSVWAALAGVAAAVLMVRETTGEQPMPTPTLAPASRPFERTIAAAGMVEALDENVHVSVPVGGVVKVVFVEAWDEVATGAPLLQLDDRDLQGQLTAQRAEVDVREAELAKIARQYERSEKLRASGAVSQEQADLTRADYAIARARLAAARAAHAQTETLIERLTVRAPMTGTVLQVNVRAGEYGTPGAGVPPVLLGSINEVQVRADVDEQLAARVPEGAKAVGYLKGDAQHPIPMTFVRIEPYVTPKRSLTGSSVERVDTRVLQVIYKFPKSAARRVYVGQQIDLFIEDRAPG